MQVFRPVSRLFRGRAEVSKNRNLKTDPGKADLEDVYTLSSPVCQAQVPQVGRISHLGLKKEVFRHAGKGFVKLLSGFELVNMQLGCC